MKELQQCVGKAQEWQRKRTEQLDKFQDIGVQTYVKEITELMTKKEGKKEVSTNTVEHPLKHYLTGIQKITEKFQE